MEAWVGLVLGQPVGRVSSLDHDAFVQHVVPSAVLPQTATRNGSDRKRMKFPKSPHPMTLIIDLIVFHGDHPSSPSRKVTSKRVFEGGFSHEASVGIRGIHPPIDVAVGHASQPSTLRNGSGSGSQKRSASRGRLVHRNVQFPVPAQ